MVSTENNDSSFDDFLRRVYAGIGTVLNGNTGNNNPLPPTYEPPAATQNAGLDSNTLLFLVLLVAAVYVLTK